MARKRPLETTSHENITEAAQLNTLVFKRLEKALASNPEADLLSLFPSTYSTRLAKRKKIATDNNGMLMCVVLDNLASSKLSGLVGVPSPENALQKQDDYKSPPPRDDVRYFLSPDDVTIVDRLSGSLRELVQSKMISVNTSTIIETEAPFFTALTALIQDAEAVSSGPVPSRRMVVKCGADTIAKVIWGAEEFTEYTTLQYLLEHRPSIPAPRPLGLLRMGRVSVLFTSYFPGTTLEAVWADLAADQKASVRDQLDAIFRDLRTMQLPYGMPFGGVAGEGCKDQRRHLRRSTVPIFSAEDFETFQFSNPKYGSTMFIGFLRAFTPRSSYQVVFTHGDLRPENVIVNITEDNQCIVVGLIDWEDSGFYPEYYEATKVTNCLATNEDRDWFRFLPPCVSPHSYRAEWLLDYLWGRHLE